MKTMRSSRRCTTSFNCLAVRSRIVLVNVPGQLLAPAGHFVEEGFVHRDAQALGAAVARQHGVERAGGDALFRELPELFGVLQVVSVFELSSKPSSGLRSSGWMEAS